MNKNSIFRILKIFILSLVLLSLPIISFGLSFFTCSVMGRLNKDNFDSIHIGDPKSLVLNKMGRPRHIEKHGEPPYQYLSYPCESNCHERIWYELNWCMGLQSWVIIFSKDGKVIEKFEILSP